MTTYANDADEYDGYCRDIEVMVGEAIRACIADGMSWPNVAKMAMRAAIDSGGWPGLRAMDAQYDRGQEVTEDAGGYRMRCTGYVFGVTPDRTGETYTEARDRLLSAAAAK